MYNNQKDICDYLLNLDVMNNGSITKDGNITNTVVNKRRINTLLKAESVASDNVVLRIRLETISP
jgi:hypothetical protein